jgi:hypothetical protein
MRLQAAQGKCGQIRTIAGKSDERLLYRCSTEIARRLAVLRPGWRFAVADEYRRPVRCAGEK